MTAEVLVMNKLAVALAADSAVSTFSKVFHTQEKIFALSHEHPVGIMVYNNVDVIGVPFETVVKAFRKDLAGKKLPKLKDYAEEFINYLASDQKVFTADTRTFAIVRVVHNLTYGAFTELQERYIQNFVNLPADDIKKQKLLEEWIDDMSPDLKSAEKGSPLSPEKAPDGSILALIDEKVNSMAEEFPLIALAKDAIAKHVRDSLEYPEEIEPTDFTGFVFAGFGEDDYFPSYCCFKVILADQGFRCIFEKEDSAISADEGAAIRGFAQTEMVVTFLRGYHTNLLLDINREIRALFGTWKNQLGKTTADKAAKKSLIGMQEDVLKTIRSAAKTYSDDNHVNPLLNAIEMMPKPDLANLAESLIDISSMKRKSADRMETVGGPTDVALITKGDGLVWTRRKHYFDLDLNPGFPMKYKETRTS
ncbi:hypothetical protein EON81_04195 [bacterium]|nr:MAG: hypothetical protein EON81_04195 [bacterium]